MWQTINFLLSFSTVLSRYIHFTLRVVHFVDAYHCLATWYYFLLVFHSVHPRGRSVGGFRFLLLLIIEPFLYIFPFWKYHLSALYSTLSI